MAAAPASTRRRSPSPGLGVILVLVGGLASAGGLAAPMDPVGVAALGRLQPDGEVVDVASPLGDRIASIVVKEGQEVALGDPLVHLESEAERRAELALAAARLQEAEARYAAERRYGEATVAEAKLRLRQAEELLPLDVRAQQASVRRLEAELANSKRDLRRLEVLARSDSAAERDRDHQALAQRSTGAELDKARAELEKLTRKRTLDAAVARAQVESAQAGLARTLASIELESLRRGVALAKARLARTVMRAPVRGRILKIIGRAGEATGGQPILQIGDVRQMYALAEVYETDARAVQMGARARVSSPALHGVLTGTVDRVGTLVSKNDIFDLDPAADIDRRVIEVYVRLDDSSIARSLVNLQVDVVIEAAGRGR